MIPLLLLVFLMVCLFVFIEEYLGRSKWICFTSVALMLILIAAFRVIGNDDDSESYLDMFEGYENEIISTLTEPSFTWIASAIHSIGGDIRLLFLVYAVIAIPLKFVAIRQLSEYLFIPVMVYVSHFFILHDMIEIRASAAVAFFMLSIKPLCEGHKKKAALLILLAVFFHYSALVLLVMLLFSNKPLSSTWKWCLSLIVPFGYVIYFLHVDLLTTIPLPIIGQKLEVYKELKEMGGFEEIFVFKNPTLLIKMICFYLLIWYGEGVRKHIPYMPLLTKLMGMSLGCFFLFSSLPVLSGRLYELFGAIDIITIASLVYIFKPAYAGKIILMTFSVIMIFMDIFVYELIR